jgi:hypothetical protein
VSRVLPGAPWRRSPLTVVAPKALRRMLADVGATGIAESDRQVTTDAPVPRPLAPAVRTAAAAISRAPTR